MCSVAFISPSLVLGSVVLVSWLCDAVPELTTEDCPLVSSFFIGCCVPVVSAGLPEEAPTEAAVPDLADSELVEEDADLALVGCFLVVAAVFLDDPDPMATVASAVLSNCFLQ